MYEGMDEAGTFSRAETESQIELCKSGLFRNGDCQMLLVVGKTMRGFCMRDMEYVIEFQENDIHSRHKVKCSIALDRKILESRCGVTHYRDVKFVVVKQGYVQLDLISELGNHARDGIFTHIETPRQNGVQ